MHTSCLIIDTYPKESAVRNYALEVNAMHIAIEDGASDAVNAVEDAVK